MERLAVGEAEISLKMLVSVSKFDSIKLDSAAVKLQKVYKSYRTRRNLADCAVVVEELWWKALDFAALRHSSVSFFKVEKHETAGSRWARARTRAAKVGKGLSKDEKAQKLALHHWLEAIDPRHRYGHNLHLYHDIWFGSESTQPFFYWLDVGDGKEVNLESCPRIDLQRQCIKYLGPKEREAYEVIVENGKLVYRQTGLFVDTTEGSKWIFVLSPSWNLYVGQWNKGVFKHSSFLSGGATSAAGRLVAHDGVLEAIWPYSGHYCPTEENFLEFICFLREHNVDLTNAKGSFVLSKFTVTNNRLHPGKQGQRGSSASGPEVERTKEIRKWEGIASDVITFEHLQQCFGSKRENVARSLGISVSTFKRVCRHHGIHRWPYPTTKRVLKPPDQHGEKNPSPTFMTLSTIGQITVESEMGGQNPKRKFQSDAEEPFLEGHVSGSVNLTVGHHGWRNQTTKRVLRPRDPHGENNPSPTFNTPSTNVQITMETEMGGPSSEPNESLPVVYNETTTQGLPLNVFQLECQTKQSAGYPNCNVLLFPQPQIASTEVLNGDIGGSECRRDLLVSQAEVYFGGDVSESCNLMFPACYDAATPRQALASVPTIPHWKSHLNECSPDIFQLENEMVQIPEPNETETEAAGGSSKWAFQVEGQTAQFPADPNPDVLMFPQSQIASTEVLSENMGSSKDSINFLASQGEAFLEGHFFESSNLMVPECSDVAGPSQPQATILHTVPTIPQWMPRLTGHSSERALQSMEFPAYPNPNDLGDPHPQTTSTQILSESMGSLEDRSNLLTQQGERLAEGHVFGSIDWTLRSCSDLAPSQPMPTILHKTRSSEYWRNSTVLLEEYLPEENLHGSINGTVRSFSDPAPSQQPVATIPDAMPTVSDKMTAIHLMPHFAAREDMRSVMLKVTYGKKKIIFPFPLMSGIIELKEQVKKRLKLELDSFDVEYEDKDGDCIFLGCDEDLRNHLQLFSNQIIRLLVVDSDAYTTNFR